MPIIDWDNCRYYVSDTNDKNVGTLQPCKSDTATNLNNLGKSLKVGDPVTKEQFELFSNLALPADFMTAGVPNTCIVNTTSASDGACQYLSLYDLWAWFGATPYHLIQSASGVDTPDWQKAGRTSSCPPGMMLNSNGIGCVGCPAGFQSNDGLTCQSCDDNTFSGPSDNNFDELTGSMYCTTCPSGKKSCSGASLCVENAGVCPPTPWRESDTNKYVWGQQGVKWLTTLPNYANSGTHRMPAVDWANCKYYVSDPNDPNVGTLQPCKDDLITNLNNLGKSLKTGDIFTKEHFEMLTYLKPAPGACSYDSCDYINVYMLSSWYNPTGGSSYLINLADPAS
jgi:hypothetical protein